jgi:hypothetical protein
VRKKAGNRREKKRGEEKQRKGKKEKIFQTWKFPERKKIIFEVSQKLFL